MTRPYQLHELVKTLRLVAALTCSCAPSLIQLKEKMQLTFSKMHQRVLIQGQFACLSVAIIASLISAGIALLVGMNRSEVIIEKIIFASVGCLSVFGAHLLLPLSRNQQMFTRTLGWILWFLCTVFVAYSHTTFFVSAQDRAEIRRTEQFKANNVPRSEKPLRELSTVLSEIAAVKEKLASVGLSTCRSNCPKKQEKASPLFGKIEALEAEAEEIKKWRVDSADHLAAMSVQKKDPLNQRISRVLELPNSTIDLVTALLFAIMLEAVACYCWFLFLTRTDASMTHKSPEMTGDVTIAVTEPDWSDLDKQVALIQAEIQAGRLKCSVKSIREFLGCAQTRAREVRKLIDPMMISNQTMLNPTSYQS